MSRTFGQMLKIVREEKGLSQENLQEITGLKREYICRIETGVVKNPTLMTVKKIVKGLDVNIQDLVVD